MNVCPKTSAAPVSTCGKTVAVPLTGPVSSVNPTLSLTLAGPDFSLLSKQCVAVSGQAGMCAWSGEVEFSPSEPGLRRGGIEVAGASTPIYLEGVGDGPEIAFPLSGPLAVGGGLNKGAGIAVDDAGGVYTVSSGDGRVYRQELAGGPTELLASGLSLPTGIAVDGAGDVFVSETAAGRVVELTGSATTTIVSGLTQPGGLAIDGMGDLLIANTGANTVVEYSLLRKTEKTVGTGLNAPEGVAFDAAGNLYIADTKNNRVVKVPATGGLETTVGTGLALPYGVAVDAAGDVYIDDSYHLQIVEVSASGVQTAFTTGSTAVSEGIAIDELGNVFATDTRDAWALEYPDTANPVSFAATPVGQPSSDSPKPGSIQNIGNEPLMLAGISASTNFKVDTGAGLCAAGQTLAAGQSCKLALSFVPTATGSLAGTAVLTDNAGNGRPATQTLALSGTGVTAVTVTLTLSNQVLTYPGGANLTACVKGVSNASGSIKIYDGSTLIATVPVQGGGCAYYYLSGLAAGSHELSAEWEGDATHPCVRSCCVVICIQPLPIGDLNLNCWNPTFAYGADYQCAIELGSNAGAVPGQIEYIFDGRVGWLPLVNGSTHLDLPKPAVGNHTLVLEYPAQGNFAAAGPATFTFVVTAAPVQVSVVPSAWTVKTGTSVTFTASVVSWSAGPPAGTGQIQLFDGSKLLATLPVNASGQAAYAASALAQGTHTMTATYVNGVNYGTGSGTATINVQWVQSVRRIRGRY